MAKDTIIPVKFEKELTTEEIEAFVDVIYDFAEAAKMKMTIISKTAVKKRVEARDSEREQANELLPHVIGSAYRDDLLKKTESMEEFAKKNYEHKEYYEGLLNGLRNMRAHINNLYRKHYR